MSAKAFILIEAKVGKSQEVVAALKGIEGVTTVDQNWYPEWQGIIYFQF